MKKLSLLIPLAVVLVFGVAAPASAAEKPDGKEVSISGEAKCAMCALKESDKCQTVIQTEEEGKKVTYYVADNAVAKQFHSKVCKGSQKVTAKGTVKTVKGKKELTLAKIDVK